jgi:hypothetical protein
VECVPIRRLDRSRTLDLAGRFHWEIGFLSLFIACWASSPSNTLPIFPIPYLAIVDDWVSDITCCEKGVVCQY